MALDHFKSFVVGVKEYQITRSEDVANELQRTLQILAATSDVAIFDASCREVVDFFVHLHELMASLDVKSNLVWSAVSVLQAACSCPPARHELIHTYKFIPILTPILSAPLSCDKQLQLLNLLQELTYGVKISWQEFHLKLLITTLTSFISGTEKQLIPISIGVLVNLCYKNLPAIYTLIKIVDVKKFFHTILNLQKDSEDIRVQVCKMIIILECLSGGLPESEVQMYIKLTCPTLKEALSSNNACLMRHIVNFFKEMMDNPKMSHVLPRYEHYGSDLSNLIDSVSDENGVSVECMAVLFEFSTFVLEVAKSDIEPLLPRLIGLSLRWLRTQGVAAQALTLLTRVLSCLSDAQQQSVALTLSEQLDVILLLLDMGAGGDSLLGSDETYLRHSALLKLLTKMMQIGDLAERLLSLINEAKIKTLFAPLLNIHPKENGSLYREPVYSFYIQALNFLTVLANFKAEWFVLLSELVKERQVLMILAIALYTGKESIKNEILTLLRAAAFPSQQLVPLSSCLADMNKLMIFALSSQDIENGSSMIPPASLTVSHLLTVTQEGYLDSLLKRVEGNLKNNCGVTSGIMELYDYKMATMSHTIRVMEASQSAADSRATKLQHGLALSSAELSRLHHLLHTSQRLLEDSQVEIEALKSKVNHAEQTAQLTHSKLEQKNQLLNSKTRIIDEQNQTISELKALLEKSRKELEEKVNVMQGMIDNLENRLESSQNQNSEKTRTIELLNKELMNQTSAKENLEKVNEEKEKELKDLNSQLQLICDLAMKKK